MSKRKVWIFVPVLLAALCLGAAPGGAIAPSPCGDCNHDGVVNIADALAAARHAASLPGNQGPQLLRCDADGDGGVTIVDALAIAQFVAGGGPAPSGCPTCGDCDLNGTLGIGDCNQLRQHFNPGPLPTSSAFAACDGDGDLDLDRTDLAILAAALGCPVIAPPGPPPPPPPALTCATCGDCDQDGDLDWNDWSLAAAAAGGGPQPVGLGCGACDVDGSGIIDPGDAGAIQSFLNGTAALVCAGGHASPAPLPGLAGTPGGYCVQGPSRGGGWGYFLAFPGPPFVAGPFAVPGLPGATATQLATAWVNSLNAVLPPGIVAVQQAGPCFIFFDGAGNVVPVQVIINNVPVCSPTGGAPCPFNPLLVGIDESEIGDKGQFPDNLTPVLRDDHARLAGLAPLRIDVLANDFDVDGELEAASVAVASGPAQGSVTVANDGTLTYLPKDDFAGEDAFTYEACDAEKACGAATVRVDLGPADPPAPVDDEYRTSENTPLEVGPDEGLLANDAGADGQELFVVDLDDLGTYGGAVEPAGIDGSFIYLPAEGFSGLDAFHYTVCDARGGCSSAVAVIEVTPKGKGSDGK